MRMVLTPQEQSLLGEARKWAMEHWNPHSDAWETARQFPREAYAQAAADGYLGLASSKQYGGRDLDALSCALVYEGLAYGDPSLTTYLHIFKQSGGPAGKVVSPGAGSAGADPGLCCGPEIHGLRPQRAGRRLGPRCRKGLVHGGRGRLCGDRRQGLGLQQPPRRLFHADRPRPRGPG